jgi:hypothetical protein
MDPTRLTIGLEISLVLIVLYLLDRNLFHYVDLSLQTIRTRIALQVYQRVLGIRLWLDRQALIHRGPVGRLWNEYSLWKIRNNPAYREFFENKPQPLPKGEN